MQIQFCTANHLGVLQVEKSEKPSINLTEIKGNMKVFFLFT